MGNRVIKAVKNVFKTVTKTVGTFVKNTANPVIRTITNTDNLKIVSNKIKDFSVKAINISAEKFDTALKIVETQLKKGINIIEDKIGMSFVDIGRNIVSTTQDAVNWTRGAGRTTFQFLREIYSDTTDFLVDLGVPRNSINTFNEGIVSALHIVKEKGIDNSVEFLEEICKERIPQGWGALDNFNETRLVKTAVINIGQASKNVGIAIVISGKNREYDLLFKNTLIGIPVILLTSLDNFNETINGVGILSGNYCRLVALELGADPKTANYLGYTITLASQIYMYSQINGGGIAVGSRGGVGVLAGVSGSVIKKVLKDAGCSEDIQDIASYITVLATEILLNGSDAVKEQLTTDTVREIINETNERSSQNAKLQGHTLDTLVVFDFTPFDLVQEGFTANEVNQTKFINNNRIGKKDLLNLRLKDGQLFISATTYTDINGITCYNFKLDRNINWEDINFPTSTQPKYNIDPKKASFHLYDGDTFNGNGKIITIKSSTSGIFSNSFTKFQKTNHLNVLYNLGIETSQQGKLEQNGGGYFYKQNQEYIEMNNCFSTGIINKKDSGGIIGKSCKNVIIQNCYSTGNITGENAGGITGSNFGYKSLNKITQTQINENKNTIFNRSIVNKSEIINCYSKGLISGKGSGGICGSHAGSDQLGNAKIINSYSAGNISGENAGGIVGFNSASNNGLIRIDNVFSNGLIQGRNAGGITGSNVCSNNGRFVITNSYSAGNISGENAGGIVGNIIPINRYEEHGQSYSAIENMFLDDIIDYEVNSKNNNIQHLGIIQSCLSFGTVNNTNIHHSIISAPSNKLNFAVNIKNCYGNINNTSNVFGLKIKPLKDVYSNNGQNSLRIQYRINNEIQLRTSYFFTTVSSTNTSSIKSGNTTTTTNTTTHQNIIYLQYFKNTKNIWNSTNYNKIGDRPLLLNMPKSNVSLAVAEPSLLLSIIDDFPIITNINESRLLSKIQIEKYKFIKPENINILRSLFNGVDVNIEDIIIPDGRHTIDIFILNNDEDNSIIERLIIEFDSVTPEQDNMIFKYFNSILNFENKQDTEIEDEELILDDSIIAYDGDDILIIYDGNNINIRWKNIIQDKILIISIEELENDIIKEVASVESTISLTLSVDKINDTFIVDNTKNYIFTARINEVIILNWILLDNELIVEDAEYNNITELIDDNNLTEKVLYNTLLKHILYENRENMLEYGKNLLLEDKITKDNLLKTFSNKPILKNKNIYISLTNKVELNDIVNNILQSSALFIMIEPNNIIEIKENNITETLFLNESTIIYKNIIYRENDIIIVHNKKYRIKGFNSLLLEQIIDEPKRTRFFGLNFNMVEKKGNSRGIGSSYGTLLNRRR
jgi:hypothetical protein